MQAFLGRTEGPGVRMTCPERAEGSEHLRLDQRANPATRLGRFKRRSSLHANVQGKAAEGNASERERILKTLARGP